MTEIEKKYRSSHGRRGPLVVDIYFRVDPCRVLRVRREGEESRLTAKGPKERLPDGSKRREEIEFPVDALVLDALRLSGLEELALVRKHRIVEPDGDALVFYDHLDGHGDFIEIEGSPEEIRRVECKLGLEQAEVVDASYLEMVLDARAASGPARS